MKDQFTVGVFGIIKDEKDRVLLILRHDYNLWNLPGGALEKNETPKQGVLREIKEETGLDTKVIKLIGVYTKIDKNEIVFSFECEIITGEIKLNEEAKEIRYFSIDEIPTNTSPKQVERIKDLFKDDTNVIMKNQIGKSSIELIKEGKL